MRSLNTELPLQRANIPPTTSVFVIGFGLNGKSNETLQLVSHYLLLWTCELVSEETLPLPSGLCTFWHWVRIWKKQLLIPSCLALGSFKVVCSVRWCSLYKHTTMKPNMSKHDHKIRMSNSQRPGQLSTTRYSAWAKQRRWLFIFADHNLSTVWRI